MFEQKNGQKPGKSSPAFHFSDTLSQSIGRGRISRERPLVVRENREWRDNFFAGKQHAILILAQNFTHFRSETTVPNFNLQWEIFFFLAAEEPIFSVGRWGGGITSILASQWQCPSWGIYKHAQAPPAFWRKDAVMLKKRWAQKKLVVFLIHKVPYLGTYHPCLRVLFLRFVPRLIFIYRYTI